MTTNHTPTPCVAEIENARDYLAEVEQMQREAPDRVTHIKLGFIRCAAKDRLLALEHAAWVAE